jgi:hypothetical protein
MAVATIVVSLESMLAAAASVSNIAAPVLKALIDQYNKAQLEYRERPAAADDDLDLEKRRRALITELTTYQNRILFEVSDLGLISRIVPFTIEQGAALYAAKNDAELASIRMSIGQIGSILERNRALIASRRNARSLVVALSVIAVIVLGIVAAFSHTIGLSSKTVIPLLEIPVPVVLWSAIGSVGAILYRFNKSAVAELADPLRWSFTRPLTGVLMGVVVYLIIKVGMLIIQPGASIVTQDEFIWLAAFLAGFSDRFADAVLRSLSGRLGGDRQSDLVTIDAPTDPVAATMSKISETLGWAKTGISAAADFPKKIRRSGKKEEKAFERPKRNATGQGDRLLAQHQRVSPAKSDSGTENRASNHQRQRERNPRKTFGHGTQQTDVDDNIVPMDAGKKE